MNMRRLPMKGELQGRVDIVHGHLYWTEVIFDAKNDLHDNFTVY